MDENANNSDSSLRFPQRCLSFRYQILVIWQAFISAEVYHWLDGKEFYLV